MGNAALKNSALTGKGKEPGRGEGGFLPSLPECEDMAEEYWEEMLQKKHKTRDVRDKH